MKAISVLNGWWRTS
ncbi:TPA: trp operon leader peptide [Escherichia coli]|nr:trp operon leader peptide [Escherichia coli]